MSFDCDDVEQHLLIHEVLGIEATTSGGGGGGDLTICDEGSFVASGVTKINFKGADVQALLGTGEVCVFIPPPVFLSHWNTSDGSNGDQSVTESISRTIQRISTPNGGQGSPFRTAGWEATNQDATLAGSATFTTPGDTTGFGGDSTIVTEVYNAAGTLIDSYTTPSIAGNNVHNSPSTRIVVTITNFGVDATKFKANASVAVDIAGIFTDQGEDGGRYHVVVKHITDSTTDAGQTFTYTQDDVFYDTNPTTPSVNGTVTVAEDGAPVTKHLSGIEYYTTGSQFTASVGDIDQLNRNTQATSGNLSVDGSDYGLPTLNHSPFGTGSSNFTGWTNNENQDNVSYSVSAWTINASNYRFFGTTGNVEATPKDGWASGSTVPGANDNILVDTYGITSTDLFDGFDDENRRQESDYSTAWDSVASLGAADALVMNGQLMVPNQSTLVGESTAANADWTTYEPDAGGTNPDYSSEGLGSGRSYYRTFPDAASIFRPNFTLTFSGSFNGADALTDLTNQDLEIFVRKVDGIGNSGPVSPSLKLHGTPYNAGTFDDGDSDGQIRLGSSTGNTINGTFGTFSMKDGVYMEIKIRNLNVKLNSITVAYS